jgi:hypothetical protein
LKTRQKPTLKKILAGRWWLMPAIVATQEAEIGRIMILSQPQTNTSRDPVLTIPNTKRAGGVAQVASPEFKNRYCKK